jgi:hypothetical protein
MRVAEAPATSNALSSGVTTFDDDGAMPVGLFNNAGHWRDRAEEALVHAEQLTDLNAKRMMLGIAESYDKLANRAESAGWASYPRSRSCDVSGGLPRQRPPADLHATLDAPFLPRRGTAPRPLIHRGRGPCGPGG